MKTTVICLAISLSLLLASFQESSATIMSYPATIEALAKSSDLVAKVKVLSIDDGPVAHSPLANDFWKVRRAHILIISALKGSPASTKQEFLYRASEQSDKSPKMWVNVGPENYPNFKLDPDHCYILFMKRTGAGTGLMQIGVQFGLRSWEGFFKCADDSVVAPGTSAKQAVWVELVKALHAKNRQQQKEAALTLLNLSCPSEDGTIGSADFERPKVMEAILNNSAGVPAGCDNDTSLDELIQSIGSASPYSSDSTRMRYLWSRAANPISAWSPWACKNLLANTPAMNFLIKVADGKHKPDVCAAAILAMGNCHETQKTQTLLPSRLSDWLKSSVPEIRAAASTLSADYQDAVTPAQITHMMQDPSPSVREAAAYSVGVTHTPEAIPILEKLLHDSDQKVQASAALSLMAYPIDKVKKTLTANLNNAPFATAFLARLASADALSVRDKLLAECQRPDPISSPGADQKSLNIEFQNGLATSPHGLCVVALINYLDGLSGTELQKSEYVVFLNAIEKIGAIDPSRTGRVYEILITHRLSDRAKAFRKEAIAAQPSLPGIAFEQPDMLLKSGSLHYK